MGVLEPVDARLFLAIAEQGGISAAARRLGLQKSLVSRALAGLEQRLEVRLMQRTTRRLSLTAAGEVLLAYARRIVEELDNAETAVRALGEQPRGELRVTAPYSVVRFVIAPRLAGFLAQYPELRLSLEPSTEVMDLVQSGFDLAVRIGAPVAGMGVATPLAVVPTVLVASAGYWREMGVPERPEALAGHRLIGLGGRAQEGVWALTGQEGARCAVTVTPTVVVEDPGQVLDLALAGCGVCAVPLLYAEPALGEGRLRRVLPGWTLGSRPIHAVRPSRRLVAPKVQVFVAFLTAAFGGAAFGVGPEGPPGQRMKVPLPLK